MTNSSTKRLVLMRHAKAAYPLGVPDSDRPLAKRGHSDAPVAGKWLREHDVVPDFIACSTALRARQTCTWVCQQLGDKAPTPKLEDRLYAATATEILSVINNVPDTVRTLLVVGHLPGLQDVGLRLASRDSEEEAYTHLAMSFPTSGLAVFEHTADWATLDGQDARVVDFAVPRAA
ncbi:MAG: phosphohistidine phosphatase [Micrococcaceae bacterium]|nr:phosphohistidine phosphatase [Micrococcaceae bacterium]